MSDTLDLPAQARDRVGKGAARAARREGLVPCVIYGDKKAPVTINIESRIIRKQLNTGQFLNTVYNIDLNGDKTRVIPRAFELDPVKDFPIHVDFLRLAANATVTVEIPVNFLNEDDAPGLKKGGVLNIVRHAIELTCPADAIPENIEIDLSGYDFGDAIHISAVTLPAGAVPTITDRDFTIATIAAPAGVKSEEEGEGEEEGAVEAEAAEETEED